MIGETVSHYRILEEIGRGGMGVVYGAEDTRLGRTVALKFLPPAMTRDPDARGRFIIEARAASALDHPNICTIHEVDESEEGHTFIVMARYEGETLKARLGRGSLSVAEALDIACQIADGLIEAHEKDIVHRDIKPANIMLTTRGPVKIMDFGLAKLRGQTVLTKEGTTLGTVAYMSPEQARGEGVDHRADIWSLGALLYEMVTGRRPFRGDYDQAVIYSILNEEPQAPSQVRTEVPAPVDKIILRALRKDPGERFQSVHEFRQELIRTGFCGAPRGRPEDSFLRALRKPSVAIPLLLAVIVVAFFIVRYVRQAGRMRWAREEMLPVIMELVEQEDYFAAYERALRVKELIPSDPLFEQLWAEMTTPTTIVTEPPGAEIFFKEYSDPGGEWWYIGRSPIDTLALPRGFFRWSVRKEGFQTVVAARATSADAIGEFVLDAAGTLPGGMVRVTGGSKGSWAGGFGYFHTAPLPGFLMDRCEVTNSEFEEFVAGGGYERREYWKHEFTRGGRTVSWEEAMDLFQDRTGRSGPSTWELGTYPEGEAAYPVTGVSWYEAAAYAEFAGKSLPSVHHWIFASSTRRSAHIIPQSNFGSSGLAPAGSSQGLGYFGEYDLAGNAREWCFNAVEGDRYVLGGCWSDPLYMYNWPEKRSPFDRTPCNGFRCIRLLEGSEVPDSVWQDVPTRPMRDYSSEEPVSDEVFAALLDIYHYDRKPLRARVEFVDDEPDYWRIEQISFDAAYGNERMLAYLFIPRDVSPPYQTVVLFPGAYAMEMSSSGNGRTLNSFDFLDFVIRSGRAAVYPVYISTYERRDGYSLYAQKISGSAHHEHFIMWHKDLSRSIDYLETRDDIDMDRLAYFGSSWGGWLAPLFLGQDERYRTAVLRLCGLFTRDIPPAFDPLNFTPRITIPVLMLNGRYDYIFPHETSQVPMFELLGTPPEDKRHVIYDVAHTTHGVRNEMIREVLDWLDRYLGPVRR